MGRTTYNLNKKCAKCGCAIIDGNKGGYCNRHRDRTGSNNPFFGKKHRQDTIDRIVVVTRVKSKKLWEDSNYRERVIQAVSKPRRAGFKEEQSERITQWYKDNPEQKETRSKRMIKSWKEGTITPNTDGFSSNESKQEKRFFAMLGERCDVVKETIHTEDGRWLMPDVICPRIGVVIEFFGNYWHANPSVYKADDVVLHGQTAQEIWDRDEERIKRLESEGYQVYIVWEADFKKDPEGVVNKFGTLLNWESCSF